MDGFLDVVAELLAVEHPEAAPAEVGRVVAACAEEFPTGDSLFMEQACTARIALLHAGVSVHAGERVGESSVHTSPLASARTSGSRYESASVDVGGARCTRSAGTG